MLRKRKKNKKLRQVILINQKSMTTKVMKLNITSKLKVEYIHATDNSLRGHAMC